MNPDPRLIRYSDAHPAPRLTVGHWFNRLTDHLPPAFIDANAGALMGLYLDGATASEAGVYARIYLRAPDIAAGCNVPGFADSVD